MATVQEIIEFCNQVGRDMPAHLPEELTEKDFDQISYQYQVYYQKTLYDTAVRKGDKAEQEKVLAFIRDLMKERERLGL